MLETCVYCGEPLGENPSKEHGLPEALGGKVGGSNPLLILTHRECNNELGRLVDSRFARGWIGRNTRFQVALRTTDPASGRAIPLGPLAPMMHTFPDGQVVDFWLGPGRFNAYHVHRPYPRSAQIGRPVNLPRHMTDAGRVYVVPRTGYDGKWWRVARASFRKQFDEAPIYLAAANAVDFGCLLIPENLFAERDAIMMLANREHKGLFDQDMAADMQFTAKLGLVVGAKLFGERFARSADAEKLRAYVWEEDADKRDAMKIVMGHFLVEGPKFAPILGFPDGHTFIIINAGGRLVLHAILFGQFETSVVLSEDASQWELEKDGVAFAYSLELRAAIGPVSLPAYIGWRGRPAEVPAIAKTLGTPPAWPGGQEAERETADE